MINLPAEVGGQIYFVRMKIEECFRDLKNLPYFEKIMNKQQAKIEQDLPIPLLGDRPKIGAKATAYGCENFACRMPVTEAGVLAAQWNG